MPVNSASAELCVTVGCNLVQLYIAAPANIMTIPPMDLLCNRLDAQMALHAQTISSALCCGSNLHNILSSEIVLGSGAYGRSICCLVLQYMSPSLLVTLR